MESYNLYGGEVLLTFDPIKHVYKANGEIVEGVTSFLKVISKPALIPWAANMAADFVSKGLKPGVPLDEIEIVNLCEGAKKAHRNKADQSASLGHIAHDYFEDRFSDKAVDIPVNPQLRNIVDAFLHFTDSHDIVPLETERRLYSREHKFAGTTDLICKLDGELTIADYKTSASGIYPEHFIQLGAYDVAYSEETGEQPTRHLIINCNAKGELAVALSSRVERNKAAAINALQLSRQLKQIVEDLKTIKTQIL